MTTTPPLPKLLADFNRYFTSSNGVDVPARVSVPRDEWRALFAALSEQGDVVYQYQKSDGSWIDQYKSSYDYNVRHGAANVRVLYARPQAAQPSLSADQHFALREAHQKEASEAYFKARAFMLDTAANRRLFESGFNRGFDVASEAAQPARVVELTDSQVDRILSASIPGGSEARAWFETHERPKALENVRQVVRLMIAEYLAISTHPAAPTLSNGLTQAETDASASVAGLAPSQAGAVTELEDGRWYWVRYEGLGQTYEAPALFRADAKAFYSYEFSGVPARKVHVIGEALAAFEAKKAGGVS